MPTGSLRPAVPGATPRGMVPPLDHVPENGFGFACARNGRKAFYDEFADMSLNQRTPGSAAGEAGGIGVLEDSLTLTERSVEAEIEDAMEVLARVRETVEKRVIGQRKVVDLILTVLLSGGHGLLVGPPGVAKTRLVETFGIALGVGTRRVQFTPDLMPADILGSEVLEETPGGGHAFRFLEGPVFTQLLMADEINRASPRTQSALLQAMQERFVTIAGVRYDLPKPFHVLATENPIEQDGIYPLPEAQLDRFLLQIDISYPSLEAERDIVLLTTGRDEPQITPSLDGEGLMKLQRIVRRLPLGESVLNAILLLVRLGRPRIGDGANGIAKGVAWGPGPRAAQALAIATRARALSQARFSPTIDDIAALAHPALVHRMSLTYAARAEGETVPSVVDQLVEATCH